ncbi:MAG TPA: NifB/NifX family molybdenum-iron cluster-binding protein [Smithellaceae bacterium]|jgi:predicted Fe-Mo cluster-binding NifX family protein|nr:NifB/NifX family molybdenum-iron cluster-binding protein [Alphaproteobacteria bacterium]HPK53889.1 NifB/NifX family molybdenum-iron cluster-binding protein [Smithellaceae bacterium]
MKIALSTWENCISTVFDAADQLLILEPEKVNGYKRTTVKLISTDVAGRASEMKDQQINVLICGAISKPLENLLIALGIEVYPFVRGSVEEVILAYQNGNLNHAVFALPGCCRRLRLHGRTRHRRGKNNFL